MKPEIREALARAAYESDFQYFLNNVQIRWEEISPASRERYERMVEAVMSKLEEIVIAHLWGQHATKET